MALRKGLKMGNQDRKKKTITKELRLHTEQFIKISKLYNTINKTEENYKNEKDRIFDLILSEYYTLIIDVSCKSIDELRNSKNKHQSRNEATVEVGCFAEGKINVLQDLKEIINFLQDLSKRSSNYINLSLDEITFYQKQTQSFIKKKDWLNLIRLRDRVHKIADYGKNWCKISCKILIVCLQQKEHPILNINIANVNKLKEIREQISKMMHEKIPKEIWSSYLFKPEYSSDVLYFEHEKKALEEEKEEIPKPKIISISDYREKEKEETQESFTSKEIEEYCAINLGSGSVYELQYEDVMSAKSNTNSSEQNNKEIKKTEETKKEGKGISQIIDMDGVNIINTEDLKDISSYVPVTSENKFKMGQISDKDIENEDDEEDICLEETIIDKTIEKYLLKGRQKKPSNILSEQNDIGEKTLKDQHAISEKQIRKHFNVADEEDDDIFNTDIIDIDTSEIFEDPIDEKLLEELKAEEQKVRDEIKIDKPYKSIKPFDPVWVPNEENGTEKSYINEKEELNLEKVSINPKSNPLSEEQKKDADKEDKLKDDIVLATKIVSNEIHKGATKKDETVLPTQINNEEEEEENLLPYIIMLVVIIIIFLIRKL